MASFPGAVYPVPSFGTNMSDAMTHTTWRDELTDEVRAIELELGTQPSGASSTVKDRIATMRHRRHRNGLAIAGAGSTSMFAGSATGTQSENVGGITFTADATNGFFTVPEAATYYITVLLDPVGTIGVSNANLTVAGSTLQIPFLGGGVGNAATYVKYLAAGATISHSITIAGAATTATVWEIEVGRLVPS